MKNKDADQLCSYCTADLHLCFRICRFLVFLCSGSYVNIKNVIASENIMITGISTFDLFYRFHVDKVSSAHVYLRLHQVHVFVVVVLLFSFNA